MVYVVSGMEAKFSNHHYSHMLSYRMRKLKHLTDHIFDRILVINSWSIFMSPFHAIQLIVPVGTYYACTHRLKLQIS